MSGTPTRIRLLNGLGHTLRTVGLAPPRPDADALIARVEQQAALALAANDPFRPFFRSAIDGANAGAGLTPFGRWGVPRLAERMVANHLRLTEAFDRRPELAAIPVERPVVVVGWYRSGTTTLHRLLTRVQGARVPRAWELYFPHPERGDPKSDARHRRRRMVRMLRLAQFAIPKLKHLHPISADDPEESTVLLDNTGLGVYFLHAFGAHEHGLGLVAKDTTFAYAAMRRQLQLLTATGGGGRWILKCPFSLWKLDELLAVFPGAQIVCIHRDEQDTLDSVCRLATTLQQSFRVEVDAAGIRRFWSDFYRQGRERSLAVRDTLGNERFVDVAFDDLVRDPQATVSMLTDALDLDRHQEAGVGEGRRA